MSNTFIFSDIKNHWAQECIVQLFGRNVVSGYPDGSFRPNTPVTRAEFATILAKAFANMPPIRSGITFKDVPSNYWASAAIQATYRAGFLSGYPDRTFRPNQLIPRVQALVALVSGLKYDASTTPSELFKKSFDDAAQIPNYAIEAIAAATQKRLVVNYPNVRRLNPNQNATRGEVAAFICRALKIAGVPLQYIPGIDFVVVVPPQFDQADSFSQGLARVKIGDKWGYIDKTGKVVIQPQFDEAASFSQGLALVKNYQSISLRGDSTGDTRVMETRGVWLTTTDSTVLNSKQNIASAMDFLAQTGFNVVFPVVWSNAYTIYPSRIMRENFGREIDPRFIGRDPLRELIVEAKRVGLAVIPWFEYGFASSYNQNGGPLLTKKPEWSALDSSGNLLNKNGFEWMNALDPDVQEFMLSLVLEVAQNYDVTGIQGDDRLPALPCEGSYDSKTTQRYEKQFNQKPPQNPKEAQWLQWRADILNDYLTHLYREVIAINPNLVISIAPNAYPWGFLEYLQDVQAWIDQGLVDLIHPQLYCRDFESYQKYIERLVTEQLTAIQLPFLVPGILLKVGSYRISPELLLQKIQYNRDRGIQGEALFFYEGLREDNEALAKVLRNGPYAQSAPFHLSTVKEQGFTRQRVSGKYSYIDLLGKPALQPRFDWVDSFNNGLARVKMGYKWGYMNKTGQLVGRFQFDEADVFSISEHTLLAPSLSLVKIGSKYGYIDITGKVVIPPQFDRADSFQEGLAAVLISGKYGYIDTTGKVVIQPQFDEAHAFSEALAKVKLTGKYGYIDKMGTVVIPPQFDEAESFCVSVAAPEDIRLAQVAIAGKWGYINSAGQIVIAMQFDEAESFNDSEAVASLSASPMLASGTAKDEPKRAVRLAAVKIDNLWGYIEPTGKLVIQPEFNQAKSFCEGLALVNVGSKWGYIRPLSYGK